MMTRLKLIDTIPLIDNGTKVGPPNIFERLQSVIPQQLWAYPLVNMYYFNHSGEKYASSQVLRVLPGNDGYQEWVYYLGDAIADRYREKWRRIGDVYFAEYDPLTNNNVTESETWSDKSDEVSTDDETWSDKSDEVSTDGETWSDKLDESSSDSEARTDSQTAETTSTNKSDSGIYGFNSAESTPANEQESEGTSTTTGSGNTQINRTNDTDKTSSGNRNRTNDTDKTSSGNRSRTNDTGKTGSGTRSRIIKGLTGGKTYSDMVKAQIDLYAYDMIDQIFADIDTIMALKIF